ncbi:toll/interleukin-1 receptor domain-containing protein [Amycolatopsis sp., V23-08]|uniref:Toll/interleukin-1 receptor domain-containing protein n=1 Tax=Amycolatopsis heterodermiae TaxID=3110235 RepID=A0ABU5R9K6_9PSEU|nr:toll/interleukin-1 receptor domain-containing protein [Amycolatopsis sp., V23-08]MEA5362910.1 toll/interleukin-1 receptor domain-containing protein [Amycolatopsis sp., V23-08]
MHDDAPSKVFISFAGEDRATACRLKADLGRHDVQAFVDEEDLPPGRDILLGIDALMSAADYFVLLWSKHTPGRSWVDAEWSAAFARELDESDADRFLRDHRVFLFIVRLDDTPLPLLLAPRKYLDARGGWDPVVDKLTAAWRRDRLAGSPIRPAPVTTADSMDLGRVTLYVHNQALEVTHTVVVPASTTGRDVEKLVQSALKLPDRETMFDGRIGMDFRYRLFTGGLPLFEGPLSEAVVTDDSRVDLVVLVDTFGPNGTTSKEVYLSDKPPGGLSPAAREALITAAFGHLRI